MRALHFPLSHSFSHKNMKSPCAEQASTSRMFQSLSKESRALITSAAPIAENLHVLGVQPHVYTRSKKLSSTLRVLTTNQDRKGVTFVSVSWFSIPFVRECWNLIRTNNWLMCAVAWRFKDCGGARRPAVLRFCMAPRASRLGVESVRGSPSRAGGHTLDERDRTLPCPRGQPIDASDALKCVRCSLLLAVVYLYSDRLSDLWERVRDVLLPGQKHAQCFVGLLRMLIISGRPLIS